MMLSLTSYVIGGILGFLITLAIFMDPWHMGLMARGEEILDSDMVDWTVTNLGHSVWAFLTCLGLFQLTLNKLKHRLDQKSEGKKPNYTQVVQADQLTDVWIHVFVGIGVIWTAIGMRSALVTTLSVPEGLANDAGQVLGRLVDGGILLALSTTIVGAIGGYLMRLGKTIYLGPALTEYYQCHDSREIQVGLNQLSQIESLLERLVAGRPHDEA